MTLAQAGGEADWGTTYRIVTSGPTHVFVTGETYLAFVDVSGAGSLTVRAADIYEVLGGRVLVNAYSTQNAFTPELIDKGDALVIIRRVVESLDVSAPAPSLRHVVRR